MRWTGFISLLALGSLTVSAQAGILFGRHHKKDADVPALIATLKTERDEHKRAAAAEELRQFEVAGHGDIVPALIDAALGDASASVRSEAVQSLGKIRPVSQEAGWALEQAASKDDSGKVRWHARTLLLTYRLAGYRSPKDDAPAAKSQPTNREPPLAGSAQTAPQVKSQAVIMAPPQPVQAAIAEPVPLPAPPAVSTSRPARQRLFGGSRPAPNVVNPSTAEPPLLPKDGDGPALPPG